MREEMHREDERRTLRLLTVLCVVCAVAAIPLIFLFDVSPAVVAPSVVCGLLAQVEMRRIEEED